MNDKCECHVNVAYRGGSIETFSLFGGTNPLTVLVDRTDCMAIDAISEEKCAYHQETERSYHEFKELKAQVEQYQGMDRVASATIKHLEMENERLNKEIDQLRGQILRHIKEKAEAGNQPKCRHGYTEEHWTEAGSFGETEIVLCPGPKPKAEGGGLPTLRDMKDMQSKNPPKNGMDSVSRGHVFLKADNPGVRPTPHCIHHGAMLNVGLGMWRGVECGCGAWDPEGK